MPAVSIYVPEKDLRDAQRTAEIEEKSLSEVLRGYRPSPTRNGKGLKARWSWALEDFRVFCLGSKDWAGLTLPEGHDFRIEDHFDLIFREAFAPNLVELLCLLPKGNQKTASLAALNIFHVLTVKSANAYIGAADKIQADEMYRFAAHFAEPEEPDEDASELEKDAFQYLTDSLLVRRSTREIRSKRDQGFIRVLASDDSKVGGKRQGFNPTLASIDELHAHDNPNLFEDMRSGLFKRQGRMLIITTAGWDEESVLGRRRTKMYGQDQEGGAVETGLAVRKGKLKPSPNGRLKVCRSKSNRTVMLEWACKEEDDLENMKVVKYASPASTVTIDSLEDAKEALEPWVFQRYRCNVWTLGFESWLPENAWEDLAEPQIGLIDNANTFIGVDMGRYKDCAAVVVVQPRDNLPAIVKAQIWPSGGKDNPIEYGLVMNHLRELDKRYRVMAVGFDPRYFDQAAEELRLEGLPMLKFNQNHERMCPASANLRAAILKRELRHDGDPVLTAHVKAGVTKDVGTDAWRLVKSKENGPPIDALIALSMAHQLAFFSKPAPVPFIDVV